MLAVFAILIAGVGVGVGIQLPPLTGRYPTGRVDLALIDYSRTDKLAPTPGQLRQYMASIFYPASEIAVASGGYSLAPYFPSPEIAAGFSVYVGNSTELLSIATQSHYRAPIASNDFPMLLYSHGLGSSRTIYTAQLESLASQGWIIVAPDHPYDALTTELPNGDYVEMLESDLDDFLAKLPSSVEIRIQDVEFLMASALKNRTILSQIPGLASFGGSLHIDQMGILGHSLGGNTAAQAVSNFSSFLCGANYDGGIFGPVVQTGLDEAFFQIEAKNHPETTDATFGEFYNVLRGFRREFMINYTVHSSFMDVPLL
jgi:hypothetical protein